MNSFIWTEKLAIFYHWGSKNFEFFSKKSKFIPPPYKTPMVWAHFTPLPSHFYSLLHTHTMYSSNSSKIEDQLTMAFQGVMEEAMSMLQAEEVAAAAGSSSTWGSKRHRWYINRDCEATHFRLWHDYFDDDCVYPHPTSVGGIVWGELFS
jgi:hypothetical protein